MRTSIIRFSFFFFQFNLFVNLVLFEFYFKLLVVRLEWFHRNKINTKDQEQERFGKHC